MAEAVLPSVVGPILRTGREGVSSIRGNASPVWAFIEGYSHASDSCNQRWLRAPDLNPQQDRYD